MKHRKIISYLLSIVMILTSLMPISAFANTGTPTITVQSVTDVAGATVDVDIVLANNPGILGAILTISYDEGLTLLDATSGEAFSSHQMTKPGKFTSPCKFVWDGEDISSMEVKNGTILTLQFKIPDDAEAGHKYSVNASYAKGDITDNDLNDIEATIINGSVNVVDYMPGDLNSDKEINTKDIILLRRDIAGGYNQQVNQLAGDVNADALRNTKDIILIRRFTAGGYEVELLPGKNECEHDLIKTEYKAPTESIAGNIEYWTCSICGKLYADNGGKTQITIADTVIEATGGEVDPNAPKITYHVANNDAYLDSIIIENPNPKTYSTEKGLVLQDLMVKGYNFVGWFNAQTGGTQVTEIAAGSTGDKVLYARWETVTYTVQFESDMVPIDDITYTVGVEKVLPKPTMDKYTFIGWSDKDGVIWDSIPVGTTDNITLYANWASNRNKAVPVAKLDDPIICEDSENGQILFVYEIGRIENVPIFEKQNLQVVNGIISRTDVTSQKSILRSDAETIGKTIANTTTNSSTWSLSKDWNETTSVSEEWAEQQGMTTTEAEEYCRSSSNTYNMTNSSGGSSSLVNNGSSAYKLSANKGHETSNTTEKQKYANLNVDGKISNSSTTSAGLSAGLGIPLKGAEASVGANLSASNTFGVEIGAGMETGGYTKNTSTGTNSWGVNVDLEGSKSTTSTSEKTWNSTQGFSASSSTSASSSVSKAVSELISQKHSKDSSYTTGGSEGESQETASSNAQEDLYSSSVTYSEEEITTTEVSFSSTGNTTGGYRLVHAGMARVFAVVGYDIRTKSYYTYTHSILDDDEYKEYLDYSFDGSFSDYETSVLPFEIPIFVNNYVNSRIATSKLQITDDGIVTKYLGDADDEVVLIPSYYTRTNTTTGEAEMIKIKGISKGLFKNNTNIVAVSLGNFINEIPESAFEGCTSLKEILCPNVVKINANAFKGCSSLSEFLLPDEIELIGENAFDGIPAIKSSAPTKEIASIVAGSNVASITLDISKIESDDFSDMLIDVGEIETFKLLGGYKEYKGLSINSDARNTIISGVTLSDCDKIPIEVSSSNLTLERVSAHSEGFALVLKADETTLAIEGVSSLISESPNSVIGKTINIEQINDETYSVIETNGAVLVCGIVNNNDGYILEESIIYISEEDYINYLTSRKVTFDANGGSVGTEYVMIPYNGAFGELPYATRDYYTFDGWYTEAEGGEKINADTIMTALTDITLYAHWVQNDVSAWTLASDIPEDAETVNTKYTYTQTLYTTSNSSSLSGWDQYKSERTSWGATQGPVYSNPTNGTRNVWSEQYVTSTTTHYKYYHRYGWYNGGYAWGSDSTASSWARHSIDLTWSLSKTGYVALGIEFYGSHACPTCGAQRMWIPDGTYTTNNYGTRWYYQEPIYTYYYSKTEDKESQTDPSSLADVSNVKEWVQYRTK